MSGFGLTVDRARIAVRIRALLYAAIRKSGVRAVAADLEVSPDSLQTSINLQAPHPSVEVLLAIIRRHGVDPTWLLTGEYDLATHREVLENPSSAIAMLARTSLRRERSLSLELADLDLGSEISGVGASPPRGRSRTVLPERGDRPRSS